MSISLTHSGTIARRINLRRAAWVVIILLVSAAILSVAVPVRLIMPFRAQSQDDLTTSYLLRSWSPWITLSAVAVILLLIVWLWSGSRWWRKAVLVIVLIPALAATWFARQNHFEWMFNPLANPAYVSVSEARFVSDSDLVMAVENGAEAVAYPIRQMAYHHVVQDTVGGIPIVVTY